MKFWHVKHKLVINGVLDRILLHQIWVIFPEDVELRLDCDLLAKLLLLHLGQSDLTSHNLANVLKLSRFEDTRFIHKHI